MAEAVRIEIQQELNASIEIGTENTESQKKANTSNENKSQYERFVSALEKIIKRPDPSFSFDLPKKIKNSFKCRIKRIPDHLRKVNEEAYTPMVISIGPFHNSNKNLQSMEKFKIRYFKSFMRRPKINLENLVSTILGRWKNAFIVAMQRLCVAWTDDFLEVILVDAIFILELIFRRVNGHWESDDLLIMDQLTFMNYDLVLLENQLPLFFVLEKLFDLIYPNCSNSSSLIDLTFKFFVHFNVQKITPKNVQIEHFTGLIRIFQLPKLQNLPKRQTGSKIVKLLYSATQLHEAGVKFQKNSSKCLHDITFESKNGVLEMPCLELYDQTEALIRNVMAFEQYCYGEKIFLRDYFLFLDDLVNTTKDIDLLCDKGIIRDHLGDNEAATSLVNKLNINVTWSGINPKYNRIFKDLNDFYDKPSHKWEATLRRQYFSTPWRIASTTAAIILLVFTFIQTVCSIIQIVPIV